MIDFTVPLNPGWTERAYEQSGPEAGDIAGISPAMLRAIDEITDVTQTLETKG